MTREEAVNVLKNTTLILGRVNGKMALAEAVNMAIEALQTDGDCISRQAAIDALAEDMPQAYTPDGSHPADEGIFMAQEIYADCIKTIEMLPSVQPEPCEDTISRADAIRVASGYCHPANVAQELAKLPSAQPEVIRCKDCIRYHEPSCLMAYDGKEWSEDNGFCHVAERRTDE